MRSLRHRWATSLEVGLVPTMGALHRGHLSLVETALEENHRVVVSIFVNPLQFGPAEDFERYPRSLEEDLEALASLGGDLVVYHPGAADLFPPGFTTRVLAGPLTGILEGAARPGHFEGVATVVTKLLNTVRPNRVYFGRKDAQQVAVVRRLVADLDFEVELRPGATVRDPDGLALSSRNRYLESSHRSAARAIPRALAAADEAWRKGAGPDEMRAVMLAILDREPLLEIDYVEMVDPEDFVSPGLLALIAIRVGGVRLIDSHHLGQALPAVEASP